MREDCCRHSYQMLLTQAVAYLTEEQKVNMACGIQVEQILETLRTLAAACKGLPVVLQRSVLPFTLAWQYCNGSQTSHSDILKALQAHIHQR